MNWSLIWQMYTLILGPLAVFMVGMKNRKIAKYGYVVGLVSQVGWAGLFFLADTPLMHIAVIIYTGFWIFGISNHFGDNKNVQV